MPRFLKKANDCFEKARGYAEPAQAEAIDHLIRFYQTGEYAEWVAFGIAWVQNDATVDFDNGFIEVYRDARGAKGSSQSFVTITDKPVTTAMKKLARERRLFRSESSLGCEVQARVVQTSGSESGGNPDRNRRFQRSHDRRQSAERKRNPREIRLEEFSVHRQQPRAERCHRQDRHRRVRLQPRRDRTQREVRHGSEQPDGRHARSHRPRLRQAQRTRQRRGRSFPEGIFFHARRRHAPT